MILQNQEGRFRSGINFSVKYVYKSWNDKRYQYTDVQYLLQLFINIAHFDRLKMDNLWHSVMQVFLCSQQNVVGGASVVSLLLLDGNFGARSTAAV